MTDLSDTGDSLNTHFNDLNLEKSVLIDIPKDIIFPNELNKFLKEKIEYLTYENGMLKKNVYDYESKLQNNKADIDSLTEKIRSYENTNEFASVANIARTKIVELSKKLREKTSELEGWKSKFSKVEQELTKVKLKSPVEKVEIVKSVKHQNAISELESEIKMLNEKFTSVNGKLFEEKNSNLILKNELKLAHKLLQDEIGETFESVQQLSCNTSWKGRAQIISDLQHKNNELSGKLKQIQEKEGSKMNDQINQKKQIWERKLEKANKEIEAMRVENVDLKRKFEAVRARCKNVEMECTTWKTKCSAIFEQSERDRELISTITSQNSSNLNSQNEMLRKKEQTIEKLMKEIKALKQDLKKEVCRVENFEVMLEEKENELATVKQRTQPSMYEIEKIDERVAQRVEAEQIRFTELLMLTNQRLNDERNARCNADYLYRQERQKAAKLEAKLARACLGDTTERSCTYRSIPSKSSPTNNSLEYKLELAEENIKALQTRLAMEKRERELDLQEFTKFVKKCNCSR